MAKQLNVSLNFSEHFLLGNLDCSKYRQKSFYNTEHRSHKPETCFYNTRNQTASFSSLISKTLLQVSTLSIEWTKNSTECLVFSSSSILRKFKFCWELKLNFDFSSFPMAEIWKSMRFEPLSFDARVKLSTTELANRLSIHAIKEY